MMINRIDIIKKILCMIFVFGVSSICYGRGKMPDSICFVSSGKDSVTMNMSISYSASRDYVGGYKKISTQYTEDISSMSCSSRYGGTDSVEMKASPALIKIGDDGNLPVYKTNVPGVGVELWYLGSTPCGQEPNWTISDTQDWHAAPDCMTSDESDSVKQKTSNFVSIKVALVQIGPIAPGSFSVNQEIALAKPIDTAGTQIVTDIQSVITLNASVTVASLACSTPSITVEMGSNPTNAFSGPGSSTRPVNFSLAINNCPADMGRIEYQFDLSDSTIVNADLGVIALGSDSTASGVGLQLKDGAGNPLAIGHQYELTGYDQKSGGSYTVPLSASYYQTGSVVTPGTANARLVFTMTYL
jgi:major type 1 subunit fimbrin (pilin)